MGTGMEEIYQITSALKHLPFGKYVALITDARFSGVSTGACLGHVSPEALAGGPIGKVREGDTIVVVASRGGDPTHPAWFLNLRDNPDVEVSYKGAPKQAMKARVATAEERARMWPLVTADHKNYADYQTKTKREIPLVLLEEVSA